MTARILHTGKLIYSSAINNLKEDSHCWFSSDDGNSPDCMFVMDNKRFKELLNKGEVVIVEAPVDKQVPVNKNQLSMF